MILKCAGVLRGGKGEKGEGAGTGGALPWSCCLIVIFFRVFFYCVPPMGGSLGEARSDPACSWLPARMGCSIGVAVGGWGGTMGLDGDGSEHIYVPMDTMLSFIGMLY